MNSRRTVYGQTALKTIFIGSDFVDENKRKSIGLLVGSVDTLKLALCLIFFKFKTNSRTFKPSFNNLPVAWNDFDQYTSLAIAPDHALVGLARNVIEVLFHILPSNSVRTQVDGSPRSNPIQNWLKYQRWFSNLTSWKLHCLTMKTDYSVPLVLHTVAQLFLTEEQ